MTLSVLLDGLQIVRHPAALGAGGPAADPDITHITDDSRQVRPGSLFVARPGTNADGGAFVASAVAAGAAAVLAGKLRPDALTPCAPPGPVWLHAADPARALALLASRLHGEPTARLSVIGVTGTNGKTTTTSLIRQLLSAAGIRCGLVGTISTHDGREEQPATLTTPSAVDLAALAARMVANGCAALAMEASSHALHQQRTAGTRFKVGVFTNLTRDHLDYHASMEAYAAAKKLLFDALPTSGTAVVNADDPWCERIVADCKARIVRARMLGATDARAAADVSVRIQEMSPSGMALGFDGEWGRWSVRVPLVGAFNAANALHAAAAAHALGVPVATLAGVLERAAAPPGRMEPVRVAGGDGPAVYVDYAHTPDALQRSLAVCREILDAHARTSGARGRLCVVVGCGGDRDAGKRPLMGALAGEHADAVFITSDNPRTEPPEVIITQIMGGVRVQDRAKVISIEDRAEAIRAAITHAAAADIVLIAGKGHEDYQILPDGRGGTLKRHFDDREEARAALAMRGTSAACESVSTPAASVTGGRAP
ncbi:MAG: UDP-N-acetylmuramoyl-L-alanyl-D-glutamate--2,6-diaminopimelate ligase [Phycisphaerales bacterium]